MKEILSLGKQSGFQGKIASQRASVWQIVYNVL